MAELSPSDEAVKGRAEELEDRLRRVAALAVAMEQVAFLLPSGSREVDSIQSLASMLSTDAALAVGDCLWLIHSFHARREQIASVLLRSVA